MSEDISKKAALSGALSGGILGLVGSGLGGANLKTALRSALLGSVAGGAVAGGGTALGTGLLGEPNRDEVNPYTRRAAVGGGLAGAGIGSLLGAALAKKYLRVKEPRAIVKFLSATSPKKSAAIGGLVGGAAGAYQAGDEGMQVDFFQNELDALERKRRANEIAAKIMSGGLYG